MSRSTVISRAFPETGCVISKRRDQLGMSLKWSQKVCERCHADRVAQQPCPECGKKPAPHETQSDLDRRRRAATLFHAGRRAPTVETVSLDDVPGLADEANQAVQRALARVSRAGEDATDLITAFHQFDSLIATLEQPPLRPRVNEQRSMLRSLLRLGWGWDELLEALTAATPDVAQRLQLSAQSHLDAGVREFDEYLELSKVSDAFQNSGGAVALALLGLDAYGFAGGTQRFADIDAALRSWYGYADLGAGFGAQVHLITTLAALYFDVARFQAVVETLTTRLEENPDLPAVLASAQWQEEYGRSAAVGGAAARALDETNGLPPLAVVDRLIGIVPRLRDGILRLGLATAQASDGDGLRRKLHGSVGALFAKADPALHLDETMKLLRDGAAHQDFWVENDNVVVTHKGVEHSYSPTEFLDKVLSVVEVALAFNLALLLALAKRGTQLDIVNHIGLEDFREIVSYLSGLIGLTTPNVQVEDSTVVVRASGAVPEPVPYFGAISAVAGRWASSALLIVDDPDGVTRVSCTLTRYVALNVDGALQASDVLVGMASVAAVTTIDGRCIWGEDRWKSIAFAVYTEIEDVGVPETIGRLRRVRGYIHEVGLADAAEFCTELIKRVRLGDEVDPPSRSIAPIPVQTIAARQLLEQHFG